MGSSANEYDPALLVTVDRVKPVSSLLTVTLAPGTMPPVLSVTVPRMLAVMRWAKLGTATLTDNRSARTATLRIMRPPLVS